MAIYLVMTLGTFACILQMRRDGQYVETIADLAGLSRGRPMMALALAIFMFSLAGIPPLAGFFGKLYVFTRRGRCRPGLVRRGGRGAVGRGRLLLSADRQADVLRRAGGRPSMPRRHLRVSAVAGLCAALLLLFVVPLLSAPVLGSAASAAAALAR